MSVQGNSADDDDASTSAPPKKILKTSSGISAIFDLKNELFKKKNEAKNNIKPDVNLGKKGVLFVKPDEKQRMKDKNRETKDRISKLEEDLKREETERVMKMEKKLKEKAALYEKLSKEGVRLADDAELLVDFNTKKREEDDREDDLREKSPPPGEVHFVPFEEQRTYGASHVVFSANEDKRQQEMNDLVKMSEETKKRWEKEKVLKEKREQTRRDRLRKLREKMGLPPEPEKEPSPSIGDIPEIPLPESDPQPSKSPERPKKEREWDRGKIMNTGRDGDRRSSEGAPRSMSKDEWVRSRRMDRDEEFAPPSFYY